MHIKTITVLLLLTLFLLLRNYDSTDTALSHSTSEAVTKLTRNTHTETSSANDLRAIDCFSYMEFNQKSLAREKTLKNDIRRFFIQMQEQEIDEYKLDLISLYSGLGVRLGRSFRNGYYTSFQSFPFYNEKLGEISFENSVELDIVLREKNMQGFRTLYRNLVSNNNQLIQGRYHLVSILGYIIESDLEGKSDFIDAIIDLRQEIYFADLVIATRMGLQVDLLDKIYRNSNLYASTKFGESYTRKSLASLAIEYGHFELLDYWMAKGSDLSPDRFAPNVLDLLAIQVNKLDLNQHALLIEKILSSGVRPHLNSTTASLKASLPNELVVTYRDNLEVNSYFENDNKLVDVNRMLEEFYVLILKDLVSFKVDLDNKHPCFDKLAKTVIHNTFKKDTTRKERKSNDDSKFASFDTKNDTKEINHTINEAIERFSNNEEIESYLSSIEGIEGKLLIEQYRIQKVSKIAESLNNENDKELATDLYNEAIGAAKIGDWKKVEGLLKSLGLKNKELASHLLQIALLTGADFEIVKKLINRGGEFPKNLLFQLIVKDDVVLTSKLLNLGLSLDFKDPVGYDALMLAVKFQAYSMFDLLINQGISVHNHGIGLDALDVALLNFNHESKNIYFIKKLLDHGAKVKLSHRQLVDKMKVSNFDSYMAIIQISNRFLLHR